MSRYIIGYRTWEMKRQTIFAPEYNTPYFDISEVATLDQANTIERKLRKDFGHLAEFRILEDSG